MLMGWVSSGAPGRIRTADASLRTAALYPLSYGGVPASYSTGLVRPGTRGGPRTVPGSRMPSVSQPLPDLVLYARPGCHLCDETRAALELLLADRRSRGLPVPALVERDIEADPELHRRFLELIPVVELGARRLELATSPRKLERLLEDVLDSPAATPA